MNRIKQARPCDGLSRCALIPPSSSSLSLSLWLARSLVRSLFSTALAPFFSVVFSSVVILVPSFYPPSAVSHLCAFFFPPLLRFSLVRFPVRSEGLPCLFNPLWRSDNDATPSSPGRPTSMKLSHGRRSLASTRVPRRWFFLVRRRRRRRRASGALETGRKMKRCDGREQTTWWRPRGTMALGLRLIRRSDDESRFAPMDRRRSGNRRQRQRSLLSLSLSLSLSLNKDASG